MKHNAVDDLLLRTLPAGTVYAVGGTVRDALLTDPNGVEASLHKNLDYLVTGVPMDEIVQRLSPSVRVELVGQSFGVLKFSFADLEADLALPRKERSTGTHHRDFDVQTSPDIPIEEDLSRRDFRINMMARNLSDGRIIDPFGGLEDLRNRRLDILRAEAFVEDPLRMLRGAQFAARFNLTPTKKTMDAMREAAPLITSVAGERVAEELKKLLTLARLPSVGFEILREAGVGDILLPELMEGWDVEQNEFHRYTVYYHSLRCCDEAPHDLVMRLAALLHDVGKPRTKEGPHFYRHEYVGAEMARALLNRLRFGSDTVERVTHLIKHHMFASGDELTDAAVRRFIVRVGAQHIDHLFTLRRADITASGLQERSPAELDRFAARVKLQLSGPQVFNVTNLAIDGNAVIELMKGLELASSDFRGDERVGAVLRHCLELVIEEPAANNSESLLKAASAFLLARGHGSGPP
ncbi:MAG: HD domain-containing protein [Candidatus Eremiobacteraeota bacterium]|nr:HD domain-containing protein [Candidatus Eremiobacteraeota bacterium]